MTGFPPGWAPGVGRGSLDFPALSQSVAVATEREREGERARQV